jgi:hypothetical protein
LHISRTYKNNHEVHYNTIETTLGLIKHRKKKKKKKTDKYKNGPSFAEETLIVKFAMVRFPVVTAKNGSPAALVAAEYDKTTLAVPADEISTLDAGGIVTFPLENELPKT